MNRPLPKLEGVEHRYLDLPELRMHVAEAGAGDPIVLLHGWPQHWWEWRHLITPLSERYRVVCPDLRGFGWSEAPASGYEKERLAADVLSLLDALRLRRVRLVGHDWGGLVGFVICLRHPERVERYLALNTGHPFTPVDARTLRTLWRFWYQQVIAAPLIGRRLVGSERAWRLLPRSTTEQRGIWSAYDRDLFLGQLREPERAAASVALYRTFILRELLPIARGRYRYERLRTQTLFLHGTRDPVIRPALLRGYEEHSDDMTLELVDGAGHFIAEERPRLVLNRALAFFAAG